MSIISTIVNVFFRAGMIEAWGRGIARILEACKAAKLPEPEIRHEKTGLWFEFYFSEQQTGNTTQYGLGEKLGETRTTIVNAMLADPKVTVVQLARTLQISTTAVEKNLQFLKERGYIERIGPAKGGYWKVKGAAS
ncbi:winged helix-turn-helix transcriptional regulator [candidate division KSB1 bacterium]|nr:winged helix-turn-helix transcriptional regulator [candidate division KSB1 bacterium]